MTSHYIDHCRNLLVSISALVLISACSSAEITPGTEVHAHVTHLPAASTVTTTTTGKQFVNDRCVNIVLASAYLTLSEMELRTDCNTSPFARLLDSLYELVLPVAQAHTESTPTRLGAPLVVNLINPDSEELEFGHFSPAAGNYCGITVHMHPADTDARNLPSALAMTGLVLYLEGSYDTGVGATAFMVETAIEPEHADVAFHESIELSESSLNAEAHLNIEYNTWFDGLDANGMADLAAGDPAAVTQLLNSITASLHHD